MQGAVALDPRIDSSVRPQSCELSYPHGMADVIFLQLAGHLSFCQEL